MISRMTTLLSETPRIALAMAPGIPVKVMTHAMMLEAPTRNIMVPDILALSTRITYNSFRSMVRYIKRDKTRLYATAIPAASVAVKIPVQILKPGILLQ